MSTSEGGIKLFQVLSEIVVLLFLASPCLLVILRLCFPECANQEVTQHEDPIRDPEKRKNDVLTALVCHKITIHDLHGIDRGNASFSLELSEVGVTAATPSTSDVEAQTSEATEENSETTSCHEGTSIFHRLSSPTYNECIKNPLGTNPSVAHVVVDQEDSTLFEPVIDERDSDYLKTCAICLADYLEGDIVCRSKNLPCRHVFHQHCLLPWLTFHDTCPICRSNLFGNKDVSNELSHLP